MGLCSRQATSSQYDLCGKTDLKAQWQSRSKANEASEDGDCSNDILKSIYIVLLYSTMTIRIFEYDCVCGIWILVERKAMSRAKDRVGNIAQPRGGIIHRGAIFDRRHGDTIQGHIVLSTDPVRCH